MDDDLNSKVFVPSWFIKTKQIDYLAELLSCLSVPRVFVGRFRMKLVLRPITLGTLSILEALDCTFVQHPNSAKAQDIFAAVAVVHAGRKAPELLERAYFKKYCAFIEFFYGDILIKNYEELVKYFTVEPFTGYEKISNVSNSQPETWLFGASTIGNMISCVAKACCVHPDVVLWEMPLTLCGHITAAQCSPENVSRPKNADDIRLQLALAKTREASGAPHPWQVIHPQEYPPSLTQLNANPEIFEQIAAEHKKYLENKKNG